MNCIDETWKDIPGYEGLYQISSLGRVKSLNYRGTGKEKELKLCYNGDYYHVSLSKNGKSKISLIHRLVALTFILNPDNKECVDHINGNRLDNRVENLRWCTIKENQNFPLARKNKSISKINLSSLSKPIYQINKITGEIIKEYPSICEAARQLEASDSNISRCCRNIRPSAYGYIWRYK